MLCNTCIIKTGCAYPKTTTGIVKCKRYIDINLSMSEQNWKLAAIAKETAPLTMWDITVEGDYPMYLEINNFNELFRLPIHHFNKITFERKMNGVVQEFTNSTDPISLRIIRMMMDEADDRKIYITELIPYKYYIKEVA
jgi:hypothetical protein